MGMIKAPLEMLKLFLGGSGSSGNRPRGLEWADAVWISRTRARSPRSRAVRTGHIRAGCRLQQEDNTRYRLTARLTSDHSTKETICTLDCPPV